MLESVTTAAKLSVGAATAATGAVAAVVNQAVLQAATAEPEPSLWAFTVGGVQLAILCTCLAASFLRTFRDRPQAEDKLFWRFVGACTDAMVGGWITVFLLHFPATTGYMGTAIPPPAVGAVVTLAWQFLRTRAPKWIDSIMGESIKSIATAVGDILKSWLARRGA